MAGRTAHGASRKSAMMEEAASPPSACSTVCSLYSVAPAAKQLRVSLSCPSVLATGAFDDVRPPLSVKRPAAPVSLTKSARAKFEPVPAPVPHSRAPYASAPFYPCSPFYPSSGARRI